MLILMLCGLSIPLTFSPTPCARSEAGPSLESAQQDTVHLKALEDWLSSYSKKKITLNVRRRWNDGSRDGGFEDLVSHVEKIETIEAANLLLDAASIRLRSSLELELRADGPYRPWRIRTRAIQGLARLQSEDIVAHLIEIAGDSKKSPLLRQAAIEALGLKRELKATHCLESVLLDRFESLSLSAADALGRLRHPKTIESLRKGLQHHSLVVRVSSLKNLSRLCRDLGNSLPASLARLVVEDLYASLGQSSWQVRVESAELLSYLRFDRSIPILIEGLLAEQDSSQGRDRVRSAIHKTLRNLTGAYFPKDDPQSWMQWWEREKSQFKLPPKPDMSTQAKRTQAGFFNIPIDSDRIVFVLDHSGSMSDLIGEGETGENRQRTKWQRAVDELEKTLAGLSPSAEINIVLFSSEVQSWNTSLKPINEGTKAGLISWLRKRNPNGGTNLFGGLAKVLKITNFGYPETSKKIDCDTVFLLSDGDPTEGELVSQQDILDAIRKHNSSARVRINTISFGRPSRLMRKLAEENEGSHVHIGANGR